MLLQIHRQDEWNNYLDSPSYKDHISIHTLKKTPIKKNPPTHPILSPNGLIFSAKEKAEIFADSLELQFISISGPPLQEVTNNIQKLKNTQIQNHNLLTTPSTIQKMFSKLAKN